MLYFIGGVLYSVHQGDGRALMEGVTLWDALMEFPGATIKIPIG